VRLCESQTPKPLVIWCLLFLWCAPCWWLGSADMGIFAKVPRKFCERVGESQSALWRERPSRPCKKILISNNLSWEGDSVMLAACLQGYEEVIRDSFVWFDRWWMNLHKRSCCSTWVPRKTNMEFAKDSRTNFSIRAERPFLDKGILINRHAGLLGYCTVPLNSLIYHCFPYQSRDCMDYLGILGIMFVKHSKTIINHPPIITIFIGGLFTIPSHGS